MPNERRDTLPSKRWDGEQFFFFRQILIARAVRAHGKLLQQRNTRGFNGTNPSMITLVVLLAVLWGLIHALNRLLRFNSASTTFQLSGLSFHLSTTALNALPRLLLKPFRLNRSPEKWRDEEAKGGTLERLWWDVGALVGVAGIVIAQAVLLVAALRSSGIIIRALSGSVHGEESVGTLVKRGLENVASSMTKRGLGDGFALKPMVSAASFWLRMRWLG